MLSMQNSLHFRELLTSKYINLIKRGINYEKDNDKRQKGMLKVTSYTSNEIKK
jgi:hypothetical protein